MGVNPTVVTDDKTLIQADIDIYSDAFKAWSGSRPGELQYNWFASLTQSQRSKEIQDLCEMIHRQAYREEVEYQDDLAQLQTYGNFTEKQLIAWDCL